MALADTGTVCTASGLAWPRGAQDEAAWQSAILAAELTALGVREAPPEAELQGLAPDPGSDPPDGPEADVPSDVLIAQALADRAEAARRTAELPELFPPGMRRGDGKGRDAAFGDGLAFGDGGVLDTAEPGVVLAGFASDAWAAGLRRLDDDQLIGVVRAWRRLSSWAAAGELAAVGELVGRRERDRAVRPYGDPLASVPDELACALTLTCRSADGLVERAVALRELPATAAALACGAIDMPKALTIIGGVSGLDRGFARGVEDSVLPGASAQTTGELRAAVRRAVLAADPAAARKRRERAEQDARVELWDEPAGTKALAGRDLPPAEVLAADRRIAAIARTLKKAGAEGSMDVLRARVYLALLAGQPLEDLLPGESPTPEDTARPQEPGEQPDPASPLNPASPQDLRSPEDPASPQDLSSPRERGDGLDIGRNRVGLFGTVAGLVNLTVPLRTLLGLGDSPGQAAGFGPLDAGTARAIASAAAGQPATRWCVTVTDGTGRAIGHGCGPRQPSGEPGGWQLVINVGRLAFPGCAHDGETPGYVPSSRLRHLIEIRDQTCSFPGCRRPAVYCDKDHTVPYDQGGRTCQCNLAPLCRRHHQVKQTDGWHLEQPYPGIVEWVTPAGRRCLVAPRTLCDLAVRPCRQHLCKRQAPTRRR